MKTVAFVPIKLDSERLKNKSILRLGDNFLPYYICESLLSLKELDAVYVFCSSESIMEYIPDDVQYVKRSKDLDGDARINKVIEAFWNAVDADLYLMAHVTSPFLSPRSLRESLLKVQCGEYDSAFSVEKIQKFTWYKGQPLNYNTSDVARTQDLEPIYVETSAYWVFPKGTMRVGSNPYMQELGHIEAIDIDDEEDYHLAQVVLRGLKNA